MKVISVANTKGGCGKSTIATNLAAIAAASGYKTLLIDTDGKQCSSLTFAEFRDAAEPKLPEFTVQSLPSNTIYKNVKAYVNFDLVIIDAGGGDNSIIRSAMASAEFGMLLIPCLPSPYDIMATEDLLKMLDELRVTVDIDAYILLNMVFPDSRIRILKDVDESLDAIANDYQVKRLEPCLKNYLDYKNSVLKGLSVCEYNPTGKAANEFSLLFEKIATLLNLKKYNKEE